MNCKIHEEFVEKDAIFDMHAIHSVAYIDEESEYIFSGKYNDDGVFVVENIREYFEADTEFDDKVKESMIVILYRLNPLMKLRKNYLISVKNN